VLPARLLASPADILAAAWGLTRSGVLPYNLLVSLGRVAAGLAIGVALGGVFGLIGGLSRTGEALVDPPLQALRTLPFLGLIPLFILWFGIGEAPKLALVAMGAFFPFYLNLVSGIRAADPGQIDAGLALGLNRRQLVRHVILPCASTPALVGLRQSIGVAWLSLVVGEQVNAQSGIGFLIADARDFLRTDVIVVGLLVYALLGLASDALVRWLERRVRRWRDHAV
jgi:sulfonate transport system permease protein